jgi:hypothetical protein
MAAPLRVLEAIKPEHARAMPMREVSQYPERGSMRSEVLCVLKKEVDLRGEALTIHEPCRTA